jgi:hypothetical protein
MKVEQTHEPRIWSYEVYTCTLPLAVVVFHNTLSSIPETSSRDMCGVVHLETYVGTDVGNLALMVHAVALNSRL